MGSPSGTGPLDVDSELAPDAPARLRFSSWSIVRALVLCAVAYIVLQLASGASTTLWWLATATVLAALFQPAALLLRRWMPGGLAITLVVIAVMAIGGFVVYRGLAEVNRQVSTLHEDASEAARELEGSASFGQVAKEFGLADKVEQFFRSLPPTLGGGDATTVLQTVASSGGALFAIGMLALLLLIFGQRFARAALDQIHQPLVRARTRDLVVGSYDRASRYVWLMAVRAVVVGTVTVLVCLAVGFPAPTALGMWFAVLSLVPSLGLVVAALPIAIGLAVVSPAGAVFVFAAAVAVQLADVVFVQRRIEAISVHVGPALTLVGSLIGLQLYGIGGAMITLALTIFGLAFLRAFARDHDGLSAALRSLVRGEPEPEPAAQQ